MAAEGEAVTNKKVIFKNCALFTDCITEINNTQVDDAQTTDIVMPMYNLIGYSDAYSKTSRSLWQYYRDETALITKNEIINFPANNNDSASFKFIHQTTGETGSSCTTDVEIMIPLKYLSNFWRTLEMPLSNCEISLQLKWSKSCILVAKIKIQHLKQMIPKLYVPIVTLSTQEYINLLRLSESGFKSIIN